MISVSLTGGLGNQLFQYAIAKNISLKNNLPVYLDVSWFKSQVLRAFNLIDFNTSLPIFEDEINTSDSYFRLNILNRFPGHSKYFNVIREENMLLFNKNYLYPDNWSLMSGYYANTSYFSDIRSLLIDELRLKKIREQVRHVISGFGKNTVGVHLRKGDYLDRNANPDIFTLLGKDYFISGIKKLTDILNISELRFIVFSDNINEAEKMLEGLDYNIEYINHLGGFSDTEQFYILSKCSHHIISNSTYSWWASYLNNNPDRICIQPQFWYDNALYQEAYSQKKILQKDNTIFI